MKSPLKTIVVMAGVVIVSTSVIVVVQKTRPSHGTIASPEGVPVAISNYSKTFKLNTNPPIWPTPANGRSTTN
jgi:hypothetical protein